MKLLIERDKLAAAVAFVGRGRAKSFIPILNHLLFEARPDNTLHIVSHDLDSCAEFTVNAEVSIPGALALPSQRINALISGLPKGAQIELKAADKLQCLLVCGRSRYQILALPAIDFPPVLSAADAARFTLSAEETERLFGRGIPFLYEHKDRPYLAGCYLHIDSNHRLATAFSDALRFVKLSVGHRPHGFLGAILPRGILPDISNLADGDDVSIECSDRIISVESAGRKLSSKLVDGTYIDYTKFLAAATTAPIMIDRKELLAALRRLSSVAAERSLVDIEWEAEPSSLLLTLCGEGEGAETLSCSADGVAACTSAIVGAQFIELLETFTCEIVHLFVENSERPIRVVDPTDPDIIALQTVCRSFRKLREKIEAA